MKRSINACKVTRADHMKLLAAEATANVNDSSRKGGFSPAQWVLGKHPRNPGSIHDESEFADLGVIASEVDPDSAIKRMIQIRQACK